MVPTIACCRTPRCPPRRLATAARTAPPGDPGTDGRETRSLRHHGHRVGILSELGTPSPRFGTTSRRGHATLAFSTPVTVMHGDPFAAYHLAFETTPNAFF